MLADSYLVSILIACVVAVFRVFFMALWLVAGCSQAEESVSFPVAGDVPFLLKGLCMALWLVIGLFNVGV